MRMRSDRLFTNQYFALSTSIARTGHEDSLGVKDFRFLLENSFERDLFVFFPRVVYPPLAEMTDEDKANSWKPGQRKKKSERVDSTWNPKSKLVKRNCYTEQVHKMSWFTK